MSPEFHIKFDDFFETVQAKATDLDAPDPESKCLSGFAMKKGTPKSVTKGGLDGLLAPRRGAIANASPQQESNEDAQPVGHQQDLPVPSATDADEQHTTPLQPVIPAAAIPLQQPETPVATACQTRSGRVIKNTPRYDQSMSLRDQGIVAWELLIDQDEQEDQPTAATQFATQRALEDYAGNWHYNDAHVDPMISKSRSGWIVCFAGAPITWASKMQTITALSTTEAEYIALSMSLREVIPLMGILKEARKNGLQVKDIPPKVHCTIFEDNSGALELARLPNMRPRTKHINQAFHHFREHVEHQEIIVNATPTDKQMADILTKPLPEAVFVRHRLSIMGW